MNVAWSEDATTPEAESHFRLLAEAVRRRATDIHLDPGPSGYRVRFRVDGILVPVSRLDMAAGNRLVNQFRTAAGIETGTAFAASGARHTWDVEGRPLDCRITLAPCLAGPKIAVRLLDPDRMRHRVTELGLDEAGLERVRHWLRVLNGMFLVTGPTASGKTTTAYALLHELAAENRHVCTIEDPVEYAIEGINQIQVDARHGLDFAEGVRTILRLDPDHSLVGELRDPEAARAAVSAAVTGHVLVATMHARDAVSAVTALRNFSLADHQIAAALGVVVNQRLVRRLCPACRREAPWPRSAREWWDRHGLPIPDRAWEADGCPACEGSGFRGRVGLFDVWRLDRADSEMLLAGADEASLRRHLETLRPTGLWADAGAKIGSGLTTIGEVDRLGLELPWEPVATLRDTAQGLFPEVNPS